VNRIYRSRSDELATYSGFQEMPGLNINLLSLELLKSVMEMPKIDSQTTSFSQEDGLSHA